MLQQGYESSPAEQKYEYPRAKKKFPLKPVESIPRFEHSSHGNNAGHFESSRYSGSNSEAIVMSQLA